MMEWKQDVILMSGGNLGDVRLALKAVIYELKHAAGEIVVTSSVYSSEPWGESHQPPFLNQAIRLKTNLSPAILLEKCQEIENKLGRTRSLLNGPRTIDIDILLFDDKIIDSPHLTIPHPRMHLRRFNMVPVAEIASERLHPVFGKTMKELLAVCEDQLKVIKEQI